MSAAQAIHTQTSTASGLDQALLDGSPRRRSLYGLVGNVVCTLSSNVYRFELDPYSGLYDIGNNSSSTSGNNETARLLQLPEFVDVRACWCTQLLDRPMEFCPAEFDTCMVQGKTDPVSCFQTAAADTFVRSFWPVAIFWVIALVFAVCCTDAGRAASQYARRTFNCRSALCNPHEHTVDDAVVNDLNQLLEREPERAAYMYRQYVIRERRRHQREQYRQRQWWYPSYINVVRIFRRPVVNTNTEEGTTRMEAATTTHTNHSTSAMDNWDATVIDPRACHRLALKTKVFRAALDEDGQANTASTDAGPESAPSPEAAATTPEVSNTTRILPTLPFHRDQENVTLEEMDDEMEHGTRCAICLIRLRDGDVIGDISCGHILHKDCLKDWLKRKNRCPLCQQIGIARLQYAPQN